ncbi:MAG: hypothetical protein HC869_16685, partial [Rhodospirillales bacterium]|nr:hypothetical protein [Rhodospirillales bacterium]
RFGLYQGNKLGADADALYRRALNGLFLPRLLYRLEQQLRGNVTDQEFVYQALKVYLMLGVQGPLDKDLVREWMAVDWNLQFAGATMQPVRDRLAGHLEVLLEQPLAEVKLDGNLVRDARRTLEQYPDAQRAYAMIKQDLAGLPTWRVADHIGPQAPRSSCAWTASISPKASPASTPTRASTTASCRRSRTSRRRSRAIVGSWAPRRRPPPTMRPSRASPST